MSADISLILFINEKLVQEDEVGYINNKIISLIKKFSVKTKVLLKYELEC